MAQKQLNKGKKVVRGFNVKKTQNFVAKAANRHGKLSLTRKGKFAKPPSSFSISLVNNQAITKEVNAKNEREFSRLATQNGGSLRVLRAPEGEEVAPRALKPKRAKPAVKTPNEIAKDKAKGKYSY